MGHTHTSIWSVFSCYYFLIFLIEIFFLVCRRKIIIFLNTRRDVCAWNISIDSLYTKCRFLDQLMEFLLSDVFRTSTVKMTVNLLTTSTYSWILISEVTNYIAPNIMDDLWVLDFIDWKWDFYKNASSTIKQNRRKSELIFRVFELAYSKILN